MSITNRPRLSLLDSSRSSCTSCYSSHVHSIISPTINNCTTSADAWNKLETSYANRSNTRMQSLMSNKKEGKTMAAYMSRVKSLVDDLALIGHPLNDAQIMSYTLNGLVDEFKELTAAIRIRDTHISFEDLYDKLLDEEVIQNHGEPNEPKEEETQVTAQLAQKRSNYRGHGGRGNRGNQNTTTHDSFGQYPQPDHTQSNQQQSPYGRGHSAKTCRSRSQPSSYHSRPQANIAERDSSHTNKNWVLDSGATHHITSDLQNLSMHSNYVGNENVIVGNGSEYEGILGERLE
ncbi:hypothetical protein JRO89_XS01G0202900 [Xanthoceras sorbifolium]|uniref:Uncharacterized protein n=1 Tax=Xanthoceras sorbifolium TaxID=99658 RepID=A0ABQ8IL77_9ROSI|nr:hypothetical protein JRO89_XS01G0202900 [Xanthoceras sorbifolium]